MGYTPRLSCPSRDNKYYNSNINLFVASGYGMFQNNGNCTAYVYGRFMEVLGQNSCKLSTRNAENWYGNTSDGYKRGSTPKLGALICWEGLGSLAGHVACVEQIKNDGTIITSNSAWKSSLFYTKELKPPYSMGSNYRFQGFIYNPNGADPSPTPTPSGNATIKYIQGTLNQRYNTGLVCDGYYGNLTKRALIKGLQHELNIQFNARISEDGIFGDATKNACRIVSKGARGNITWLIQAKLYCIGYSTNGIDGIYGNGTQEAVRRFQANNGLIRDGICGKNTFEKLFK
jgi:surface antigen